MSEYTPSELAVQIADEWLNWHRKNDTWRIVDMLRDEVVRLAAQEPTPLQESIERRLVGALDPHSEIIAVHEGYGAEVVTHAHQSKVVAAVLPIVAGEVQAAKAEALDEFVASLADHLDLATPRAWDFHHPCDPPGVRWEPNARDLALMDVADMLRNDTRNPYRAADIEKEDR